MRGNPGALARRTRLNEPMALTDEQSAAHRPDATPHGHGLRLTQLGLHRLELGHALGHDASCRIAGTCGFAYEGTLRDAMF